MLRTIIQNCANRKLQRVRNGFATNAAIARTNQFSATPLISCKQKKFNLTLGTKLPQKSKFGSIELASQGWKHHKAKGDFFTIHPSIQVENRVPGNDITASFDQLGLDPRIVKNLAKFFNVTQCTYVQREGIPQMLAGDHTLIAAETGCGKTLAYLVPIVQQILQSKKQSRAGGGLLNFNSPIGLVLTPGRELGKCSVSNIFIIIKHFFAATQIGEVADKLCTDLDISVNVLLGGRTKQKMLNPVFDDVDLLIGTIGATSKLVTTGVYRMHLCQHVVLDEADTLLDDSFNEKLKHFLRRFPASYL